MDIYYVWFGLLLDNLTVEVENKNLYGCGDGFHSLSSLSSLHTYMEEIKADFSTCDFSWVKRQSLRALVLELVNGIC